MADGKTAKKVLALEVLDPAMGSAHFLVGATRRLAEHLLAAYRRDVAKVQAKDLKGELSEDDLLVLADVPDELVLVDEFENRAILWRRPVWGCQKETHRYPSGNTTNQGGQRCV